MELKYNSVNIICFDVSSFLSFYFSYKHSLLDRKEVKTKIGHCFGVMPTRRSVSV